MIGYLKGVIAGIQDGMVLIEVGGIGYLVEMPLSMLEELPAPGGDVQVFTHLLVKDDRLSLYGFTSAQSLMVFKVLLEVSGVGPKLALKILSVIPPQQLLRDIAQGDSSRLRGVHGVGKKTAARICVDLKERAVKLLDHPLEDTQGELVKGSGGAVGHELIQDAVSALVNLGYKSNQARRAVTEVTSKNSGLDLSSLIREALQLLSKVK